MKRKTKRKISRFLPKILFGLTLISNLAYIFLVKPDIWWKILLFLVLLFILLFVFFSFFIKNKICNFLISLFLVVLLILQLFRQLSSLNIGLLVAFCFAVLWYFKKTLLDRD